MILLKTSPAPMGLNPGFLLSGMSRQGRSPTSEVDSSSVLSFLVTLVGVWQRSEDDLPKFFDNKIHFQPSASTADPLLALLGVFSAERLITLRFHEHLLGRDVSVWEGSMLHCSGVIFRFLYSRLAD